MPVYDVKRGLSALEAWGRKITSGYKDVHIEDLSTSWRDGLAFCAIIHHFRPDLIDYNSLSKEDVLYNNQLAFSIAEKHLSIPALLDAEDMLKQTEPDKRSIALYLSEYYNFFEGKRKLRQPEPGLDKEVILDDQCYKLQTLIQSLDQIEFESLSDTDDNNDQLLDEVQSLDDNNQKPESIEEDIEIVYVEEQEQINSITNSFDSLEKFSESPEKVEFILEPIEAKKQKFIERNKVIEFEWLEEIERIETEIDQFKSKEGKLKSLVISTIQSDDSEIKVAKTLQYSTTNQNNSKCDYPDNLNPFGNDDDNHDDKDIEIKVDTNSPKVIEIEYPDDLNPFENIDETKTINQSSSSLNPFGSESEDDNNSERPLSPSRSSSSQMCQMKNSKKKKRPAPLPPNKSNQSLNSNDINNQDNSIMYDSLISTASSSADLEGSGLEHSRTPTPTPRRSKMNKLNNSSNLLVQELSTTLNSYSTLHAQLKAMKNKKRPAPPIPTFKRSLKNSSEEMDTKLKTIINQLSTIETEFFELEQWLLDYKKSSVLETKQEMVKDNERTADNRNEYEQKLERFLELAKQKCKLERKQKEFMYMKREIKLEEIQLDVEYQLRIIMAKQDAQKTERDRCEEQRLLNKMMELINERNEIIENMIEEENNQIEEYQNMIAKIVPKNSSELTLDQKEQHSEKSKHLKSFLKLKTLNTKFKTRIKKRVNSDNNEKYDESWISEAAENCSPTPILDPPKVFNSSEIVTKKIKRKDLTTFGRSTLKKLTHPSKTFHIVSNEIKSKLQNNSNL